MTALPLTSELFHIRGERVEVDGVTHRLLLKPEHKVTGEHVHRLLRETYHEVVLHSLEVRQAALSAAAAETSISPSMAQRLTQQRQLAEEQLAREQAKGQHPAERAASASPLRVDDEAARLSATRGARWSAPSSSGRRSQTPPGRVSRGGASAEHFEGKGLSNSIGAHRPAAPNGGRSIVRALSHRPLGSAQNGRNLLGSGTFAKPTLRLRSSNCPALLSFTDAATSDARVGGRRSTFSVDFDRTMETNVVNRLHKALDEVREQHVKVVASVRAVASALALGAFAALALDVAAAFGLSGRHLLVGALPGAELLAWRHAICVLVLLMSTPLLILTVQPRNAQLLQSRCAIACAILSTLIGVGVSLARALHGTGVHAHLAAAVAAGEGLPAAAARGGLWRVAGGGSGGGEKGAARCLASAFLASPATSPARLGKVLLTLVWTVHCGRVHAFNAGLLALSAAWLVWRCASQWKHGPRLLDSTWAAVGLTSITVGLTMLSCRAAVLTALEPCGSALADGAGGAAGAAARSASSACCAALLVAGLLALLLGAALSWPASRRHVQAALARATGNVGTYAPLAPLIGYGCVSSGEVEPEQLYAEAMATFVAVPLDASLRAQLDQWLLPNSWANRRRAARAASAEGAGAAGAAPAAEAAPQGVDASGPPGGGNGSAADNGGVGCGSSSAGGAAGAGASAAVSGSSPPPSPLRAGEGEKGAKERQQQKGKEKEEGRAVPCADYYVCHSWEDDAQLKIDALKAWGEQRERELGRPPTLWMDAFCADPALKPPKLLQHMPICLAKCTKLLLLCGPTVVDRLWCVTELFCWRATGGKQQDVEVVLVAPPGESAELEKIVACFDAFHVMWCSATLEEDQVRMEYAVELATVSRFNDRVRWFYPLIQQAVRAQRALHSSLRVPCSPGAAGSEAAGEGAPQGQAGAASGMVPAAAAGSNGRA